MRFVTRPILSVLPFFAASLLGACGGADRPVPGNLGTNGSSDQADALPKTESELLADALAQEKGLLQRRESEGSYLSLLRGINRKFCVKLAQFRAQCPTQARLVSDDVEQVLGCVGDPDQNLEFQQSFKVSIDGQAGVRWRFRADNTYETGSLENGAGQVVSFHQNLGQSVLAPRLNEVTDLRLIPVDPVAPGSAVPKIEFNVGATAFFTEHDLLPVSGTEGHYRLDPGRIFDLRSSDACRVTAKELDDIAAQVKEGGSDGAVTPSPAPAETEPDAGGSVAQQLEAARKRLETVKQIVAPISEALDRERDRNGKLRKEILNDNNIGCFATQPINKIEILVRGLALPRSAPDSSDTKAPRAATGNPRQFQFWFGDALGAIHPDEAQQSIFNANGRLVVQGLADRKIADIEHATVKKGGIGAFAEEDCSTVLGLFKRCSWRNGEADMYRLDGLTVKVNDEVLYQNENINYSFKKGTLQWNDARLRANPAYVRLMNRSDCPIPGNGG